jgi:hypothetical protein
MPISTKLAAILSAATAMLSYVITESVFALPSWAVALATVASTGIVAWEAAENT